MFKKIYQSKRFESLLTIFASFYVIFGLAFAFLYAIYYKWSMPFSLFSPPFFSVLISWPFQTGGFIKDILYYGISGKPI